MQLHQILISIGCPFAIEEGDTYASRGEDGKHYLMTSGMIKIEALYKDLDTNAIETAQLKYYDKEVLMWLWDRYELARSYDNSAYAKSIEEFMKTVYTTSGNYGEILICKIKRGLGKEILYIAGDNEFYPRTLVTENIPTTFELVPVNYDIVSAKFGTPVEFLVNLLEITGSQDFVSAFIAVAARPQYYIKLGLYDLTTEVITLTEEKYTQDTLIEGVVDLNTGFEVRYVEQTSSDSSSGTSSSSGSGSSSGFDSSGSDGLTSGGVTIAPSGTNPVGQPGTTIMQPSDSFVQPSGSFPYTSRAYTSRAEVTRTGTLAVENTHYAVTDLGDGTTAITIVGGTQTQNRDFYLYLGNRSGVIASDITIEGRTGPGWIIDLNLGEYPIKKKMTGLDIKKYTLEIGEEDYYEILVKEVNCWWCNIDIQPTETKETKYINVTEDGENLIDYCAGMRIIFQR